MEDQKMNEFYDQLAFHVRKIQLPTFGSNRHRPGSYEYHLFELLRVCNRDNVDLGRRTMKLFVEKMGWTDRIL